MEPNGKLFILHLDDRRYALELADVERVVRMVEITPLPAPKTVLGLINLQGAIVPVLDLRGRFQLPLRLPHVGDVLVIVSSAGRRVALAADRVGEIVSASGREPLPSRELFPGMEYLKGVLKTADGLENLPERGELPVPSDGVSPTEEDRQRTLLRERARRLAVEPEQQLFPEDQLEVVEFTLSSERYAIESSHVREVYPYRELVRLPGAPDFLLGIMNVRGKIHSVLDLRRFFQLPVKGTNLLSKVIILQGPRMVFGIVADTIAGVSDVPLSDLQPGLLTFAGNRAAYVRGVTRGGVTLLDGGKILSDRKLVVHLEV